MVLPAILNFRRARHLIGDYFEGVNSTLTSQIVQDVFKQDFDVQISSSKNIILDFLGLKNKPVVEIQIWLRKKKYESGSDPSSKIFGFEPIDMDPDPPPPKKKGSNAKKIFRSGYNL